MITCEEANLHSADRTKLFYRRWEPDKPKAVLLFVHGVGEHSGRYVHVGEHFAGRGFATRVVVPLGGQMSDGLKQAARRCAEACPTGAFQLKERG